MTYLDHPLRRELPPDLQVPGTLQPGDQAVVALSDSHSLVDEEV